MGRPIDADAETAARRSEGGKIELKRCCRNCALFLNVRVHDGKGFRSCDMPNDFVCLAFLDERIAALMCGTDADTAYCEAYCERGAKYAKS